MLVRANSRNITIRNLVDGFEAEDSKNARHVFLAYKMRNLLSLQQVFQNGDVYTKADGQKLPVITEAYTEITFQKDLAQLLDFSRLQHDLEDLIKCCSDDVEGRFEVKDTDNGKVMRFYGTAYLGSLKYLSCAIPLYIEDQYESMMKKNPRAFPLFYAWMEMDKMLKRLEQSPPKHEKLHKKFENYKKTMTDLMHVLDVLQNSDPDSQSQQTATYRLETPKNSGEKFEILSGDSQELRDNQAFEKLLIQLHRQSKEMTLSKNGAVIGGLMMAFGAMMVAAGVAAGITLGWTGIDLGVGVGLSVAGAGLFAGGLVAIKEREHFSTISRRMNDLYNQMNETHKPMRVPAK